MFFHKSHAGEYVFDNGWKLAAWWITMGCVMQIVLEVLQRFEARLEGLEYGDQN